MCDLLAGSQFELIVYTNAPASGVVIGVQTSPLKQLGQSKPNFMWSLLGKADTKANINGHMTKMAAMPIYGKNL